MVGTFRESVDTFGQSNLRDTISFRLRASTRQTGDQNSSSHGRSPTFGCHRADSTGSIAASAESYKVENLTHCSRSPADANALTTILLLIAVLTLLVRRRHREHHAGHRELAHRESVCAVGATNAEIRAVPTEAV